MTAEQKTSITLLSNISSVAPNSVHNQIELFTFYTCDPIHLDQNLSPEKQLYTSSISILSVHCILCTQEFLQKRMHKYHENSTLSMHADKNFINLDGKFAWILNETGNISKCVSKFIISIYIQSQSMIIHKQNQYST